MGNIIKFPQKDRDAMVIQIIKDRIMVDGVACELMDLKDIIVGMNTNISPQEEKELVMELFDIFKQ